MGRLMGWKKSARRFASMGRLQGPLTQGVLFKEKERKEERDEIPYPQIQECLLRGCCGRSKRWRCMRRVASRVTSGVLRSTGQEMQVSSARLKGPLSTRGRKELSRLSAGSSAECDKGRKYAPCATSPWLPPQSIPAAVAATVTCSPTRGKLSQSGGFELSVRIAKSVHLASELL